MASYTQYTGLDTDTIISGLSIYQTQTCTSFTEGIGVSTDTAFCSQWVNRRSLDLQTLPQLGAKTIMFGFAMVSVIFIILRVLRKILHIK